MNIDDLAQERQRLVIYLASRVPSVDLEDVAQDILIKIMQSEEEQFGWAYVMQAARWSLGQYYRRHRRQPVTSSIEEWDASTDPYDELDELLDLDAALDQLTPTQEEALAAGVMATEALPGNIRTNQMRARKVLREACAERLT